MSGVSAHAAGPWREYHFLLTSAAKKNSAAPPDLQSSFPLFKTPRFGVSKTQTSLFFALKRRVGAGYCALSSEF